MDKTDNLNSTIINNLCVNNGSDSDPHVDAAFLAGGGNIAPYGWTITGNTVVKAYKGQFATMWGFEYYDNLPYGIKDINNTILEAGANPAFIYRSSSPSNATIGFDTISAKVTTATENISVNVTTCADAKYKLYFDAPCKKAIANNNMKLDLGANKAYIKVVSSDGSMTKVYTVNITRTVPAPPTISQPSVSPAKFIANGTNKLSIASKLTTTSGFPCLLRAIIKNANGKIVATLSFANQVSGAKNLAWNGKATSDNTAGLKTGAIVPASIKGTAYKVYLVADNAQGSAIKTKAVSFKAYSK